MNLLKHSRSWLWVTRNHERFCVQLTLRVNSTDSEELVLKFCYVELTLGIQGSLWPDSVCVETSDPVRIEPTNPEKVRIGVRKSAVRNRLFSTTPSVWKNRNQSQTTVFTPLLEWTLMIPKESESYESIYIMESTQESTLWILGKKKKVSIRFFDTDQSLCKNQNQISE